jgi:hypothetical protein
MQEMFLLYKIWQILLFQKVWYSVRKQKSALHYHNANHT